MQHPHRFLGNSALWWDLKNDVTISTPWYLGLVFRTRARDGTLLQAQAGQYTSLLFQVDTTPQFLFEMEELGLIAEIKHVLFYNYNLNIHFFTFLLYCR